MLSDIPIEGTKKLNICLVDIFERDLKNVLETLEKLCQGNADHADYVKAYKYFVERWSPEADALKRVPASMGYKFGKEMLVIGEK